MRSPSTPRGWLAWAASVAGNYHRTHSPRFDRAGETDRRLSCSRETAISIIRLCEKSSNGHRGAHLLFSYYVEDASWRSFTKRQQRSIARTAKAFAQALRDTGFLPKEGEGGGGG